MMQKWIYLTERRRLEKGPVSLSALVDMIQSGRLSAFVIVAPTAEFRENGLCAYMWPKVAGALAADLPKLCRAWVRNSARRTKGDHDFWAWVVANELVEAQPARGWRVVCALVGAAPPGEVLGDVGAGPLEDMIRRHPTYHAQIVSRAKRDPKFRQCLGNVWDMHLTKSMREVVGHRVP